MILTLGRCFKNFVIIYDFYVSYVFFPRTCQAFQKHDQYVIFLEHLCDCCLQTAFQRTLLNLIGMEVSNSGAASEFSGIPHEWGLRQVSAGGTSSGHRFSGKFPSSQQPCYSKCGLWICSTGLPQELVRNVGSVQKQPKCLSVDKWIKKQWYICAHKHAHKHGHTHRNVIQP